MYHFSSSSNNENWTCQFMADQECNYQWQLQKNGVRSRHSKMCIRSPQNQRKIVIRLFYIVFQLLHDSIIFHFQPFFFVQKKGACHFHVPPFHYRKLFHNCILELTKDQTRWVDLAHFSLLSTCFLHQNQQVAKDINVRPKSCIWLPAQLFNLNKNIKPYTTFVRMKPGEVSVRMFLLFCFVFN